MHRKLVIALSLLAVACTPSRAKVVPTPASSGAAMCSQERAPAVLYLVDGLPATCTTAMSLATDRIASVEVLKGPSAAAYGASAAAGVVIIQTKRDR
jgi:TonB-dependent SusC/RagA subfamily outer membrane receptor